MTDAAQSALDTDGFFVTAPLLDLDAVVRLITATANLDGGEATRQRNSGVYARRNLLTSSSEVRALAGSPMVATVVAPVLGSGSRCVRGILFDKTAGANCKVAWHQDLSIAVKQRIEVDGFGPWSVKAGVQHVQPPRHILESMLTVRIHLDECGEDNGPLKALPGSHAQGVLDVRAIEPWHREGQPRVCVARAGESIVMRPLLLHASSSATHPGHRRVVHLEFAAGELPGGFEWEAA